MTELVAFVLVLCLCWTLLDQVIDFPSGKDFHYWLLGAAVVVLPNLAMAVGQIFNLRTTVVDQYYNVSVHLEGIAGQVLSVQNALLVVVAAMVAVRCAFDHPKVNRAAALFLGVAVVGCAAEVVAGANPLVGQRILLLALLACLIVVRPTRVSLRGAALGITFLFACNFVAVLFNEAEANPACGERKCGAFGSVFTGAMDNNNSMGIFAAAAIPVLFLTAGRYRIPLVLLATAQVLASGSRTASLAAIVMVAVLAGAALIVWRDDAGKGLLVRASLWSGVAMMVVLPLIGLDASIFTGRGFLWSTGLAGFRAHPIIGNGAAKWGTLASEGLIGRASAYSTHNQFVDVLYVAGIAGLVCFVCAVVVVARRERASSDFDGWLLFLLPLVVMGIAERPWGFGQIDWMTWSLVLFTIGRFPFTSRQVSEASTDVQVSSMGGTASSEAR